MAVKLGELGAVGGVGDVEVKHRPEKREAAGLAGKGRLTLAIYAKVMVRRDGEPERLRALVNGDELHPKGAGSRETAEGAMP